MNHVRELGQHKNQMFTPPFGVNIFVAQAAFKQPVGVIYWGVLPFIWLSIAVLMLITYVPVLSIGLLKWM
jgi:C4-dicarboxylate transporter DctM subunit